MRITVLAQNGVDVEYQFGGLLPANAINPEFLKGAIPGGDKIQLSEFAEVMTDIRTGG